jgi:predicted peptidase
MHRKIIMSITAFCSLILMNVTAKEISGPQLIKEKYISVIGQQTRQYFVYLPTGYDATSTKKWPLMLFLHGNGERGNGNKELDFVLHHGPLYEAWVQRKDLPFIIISPQLPMFDQEQAYMTNRKFSDVPKRLENGAPSRPQKFNTPNAIVRNTSITDMRNVKQRFPQGWEEVEQDLLNMLKQVESKYQVNQQKIYLTGLSYGGAGTWYMASQHPEKFAAIVPVVGWGYPDQMAPIAKYKVPTWAFAAGRDRSVGVEYFYAGIDELRQLGHTEVRFTVHEDMGHDAWTRVYQSTDVYDWLLSHSNTVTDK